MKRIKKMTVDPDGIDSVKFKRELDAYEHNKLDAYEHNIRRIPIVEAHDKPFIVLTNDPSLTAWGWAILDHTGHIEQAGCIKTSPEQKKRRIRKGDDTMRRISEINHTLKKIVEAYNVNYILAELPHGSQNASAARMIGMVAGVLQTISDWTGKGIEWYSEADAKKAALGKISATKQEMIDAMNEIYGGIHGQHWQTGVKYKDEAIADALAIHCVAMEQSPVLKFWKWHD